MRKPTINSKTLTRRAALLGVFATGVSLPYLKHALQIGSSKSQNKNTDDNTQEFWISAQGSQESHYSLGWVNPSDASIDHALTKLRGHGVAQHPTQHQTIVMMSRRPGTVGVAINIQDGHITKSFQTIPGRQFEGHACFNNDGGLLLTSESESKSGRGKIGVYDGVNFTRLGEFDSYGIGPHEIKLMPDGSTLAIANGGLHKPLNADKPTNLDTMKSTLAYVDIKSGELLNEFSVEEPKASIRHLDVASDGTVAIASQIQRSAMDSEDVVALSAIQKAGEGLTLLKAPEAIILKLNDYMGSVAVNHTTRIAGFTSPRGNLAVFWHLDDEQKLAGYHAFHDVCGITVTNDQDFFVLSNSSGQLRQLDARTLKEDITRRIRFPNTRWDNHLSTVTTSKNFT